VVAAMGGAVSGSDQGMAAGGIVGLIALIAYSVMVIALLVFMFLDGTRGPNQYGPDPKGNEAQTFA
jgi:uncharacterized membrane protein YhaH (DUF805 family)